MAALIPIILDVDTGVDDALALGYAARRDDADLIAVTTLAGNIDVVNATENTLRVLGLIGKLSVPIYRGASRPLVRIARDASYYHGQNGLGDAELPTVSIESARERGPAAIIRMARERPGEIVLVAVGPLTNIAIALNVFPDLPSLLKRFVIMGGAFRNPGNVTPHAEFNIWADPEAAQQVFAARFPEAIAVGLDVSHQTLLTTAHWREASTRPDPFATLLTNVCASSFTVQNRTTFPLHDPLATAVALDPSIVTLERGDIDVVLTGEQEGKTVFTPNPAAAWQVAMGVQAEWFVADFVRKYLP